jgi:hypothetical protein
MAGEVGGRVGDPISQGSRDIVAGLGDALAALDPKAGWQWAVSGVNSGVSDQGREAYAFVWKATPAGSVVPSKDPVGAIALISEPVILPQPPTDDFPGRRPAMIAALVTTKTAVTPVNIISYHAPPPCNQFSKGAGSGYGINALATLPEVGGGLQGALTGAWVYRDGTTPLPRVATIVLGDFNFTMDDDAAGGALTYRNLLTNYQGCVSTPGAVQKTTYAPDATHTLELGSAEDNIFLLKKHESFTPTLATTDSGVIDFIQAQSKILGEPIGFHDAGTGTHPGWYVIHRDRDQRQHAVRGLSEHLPVWAEFTVADNDKTAAHIRPTCAAHNNSLIHAMFGADNGGVFIDATAAQRRLKLVTSLQSSAATAAFTSTVFRDAVLEAMLNDVGADPTAALLLQRLIGNTDDPFAVPNFPALLAGYITNLLNGRMLSVQEVALLAIVNGVSVMRHYLDRGHWKTDPVNADAGTPVHIYQQGLHFWRWQP